jgi:hypothetical protein
MTILIPESEVKQEKEVNNVVSNAGQITEIEQMLKEKAKKPKKKVKKPSKISVIVNLFNGLPPLPGYPAPVAPIKDKETLAKMLMELEDKNLFRVRTGGFIDRNLRKSVIDVGFYLRKAFDMKLIDQAYSKRSKKES